MNKRIENHKGTGTDGRRVVAMFGEARLLLLQGMFRLEGGTMTDRVEAMEWANMVCPEMRLEYED